MSRVHVDAVGLVAPGMESWPEAVAVLRGAGEYVPAEVPRSAPEILPANERRRVSSTVRLALRVAEEAMAGSSIDLDGACSVFATCDGDTGIIDRICQALSQPGRPVSPTQFHNSVHNAASGYWAIAARCAMPSTTVSAYRASFAAGLMEASAQLAVERRPVLLVAYDYTPPETLAPSVGEFPPFAAALVLSPEPTAQSVPIRVSTVSGRPAPGPKVAALAPLYASNPAASALPLLEALAAGAAGTVILDHVNGLQVAVDVERE